MNLVKMFNKNKPGINYRALLFCYQSFFTKFFVFAGLSLLSGTCFSKTLIYVADTDSHTITAFQLNQKSGKARLLQKIPVGGAVMPMASSMVPGMTSGTATKRFNRTGNALARDHLLYAAIRSEPYRLIVMAINPDDGTLNIKTSAPLIDSMANIALDRDGRYLLAASYGGNKISAQQLDAHGIPGEVTQVLATGAHPHQITVDRRSQFVYVSLLGWDRLDYYRLQPADKNTVVLKPMNKPAITLTSGSGPRHFVFSNKQNFIYLLNELNASVQVLQRDLKTGELSLVETHALLTKNLKPWAADIHITPDGKFLYATERTTHRIFGFAINQKTGQLRAIADWKTEAQPRAFGISPQGDYLVVVGQKSSHMSIYRIAPDSGRLELVDRQATGKNPSWVEIIELSGNE